MPRQFLLESISVDPSNVNEELFATIRSQTGVLSVGMLPKSSSSKLNSSSGKTNSTSKPKVALLSVEDAAADAEGVLDNIKEAAKKVGLAIFTPSPEEKKKQQEEAAAKRAAKTGGKKKVPLTQTAFTAKPTEAPKPKSGIVRGGGGRGGAANSSSSAAGAAATGRGGAGNSNNNNSAAAARGGSGRGGGNRTTSQRGGRGGRGGGSNNNNRGGRGAGRGAGRGGRGAGRGRKVPTHMQAMMALQPPNELLNRAAGQQQAAMMMNMMNNMMMQQQTAFFNNPYYNHHNSHFNGGGVGPGGRLWTADVHAIFLANVAPPVTNKQLSLAAGEDIVMVHIERGEDVAIMYVATEQQARSAVMKLNGSYLYDRTLNVSYGGRKQIPLPYPPNQQQQQQPQQHSTDATSAENKKKEESADKKEKHVDPAAAKTESK